MYTKTDIRTKIATDRFDVRSSGILIQKGHILVSTEDDGTQTLPGGAVKTGESSQAAVIRELKEESGLDVKTKDLMAVIENFFVYEGDDYHQVLFLYHLQTVTDSQTLPVISGIEKTITLSWLDLASKKLDLRPPVLNEVVTNLLANQATSFQHLIYHD